MDEVLLTEKNKQAVDTFAAKPSHAVLLVGKYGYGKRTLAENIAKRLLSLNEDEDINHYPYFYLVEPENNLINIDKIRSLKKLFQLKTTGSNRIRRVVVIEDAETMNDESQNAILKILEEPPIDSVIIMTSSNEYRLKPTVLSRTQKIKVSKPSIDEVTEFYTEKGYDVELIRKNYIFSNGAIGLISSLLGENEGTDYNELIASSKHILSSNLMDKLIAVDELAKDKDNLKYRIYCLKQIAKTALYQAIAKKQDKMINYWLNALSQIQVSEDELAKGANSKLMLTNLFLHL